MKIKMKLITYIELLNEIRRGELKEKRKNSRRKYKYTSLNQPKSFGKLSGKGSLHGEEFYTTWNIIHGLKVV